MTDGPKGQRTRCPVCNSMAIAIVPPGSELVQDKEKADGKVWVNCHDCDEQFLAYYQTD